MDRRVASGSQGGRRRRGATTPAHDFFAPQPRSDEEDDDLAHLRREDEYFLWRDARVLELEEQAAALAHRNQMRVQAQWIGTLKILLYLVALAASIASLVLLAMGGMHEVGMPHLVTLPK